MSTEPWPQPPAPGSFDGFIYVETGDPAIDVPRRMLISQELGSIPQRITITQEDA